VAVNGHISAPATYSWGRIIQMPLCPGNLLLEPNGGDFMAVHVGFVVDYGSPYRICSGLGFHVGFVVDWAVI